MNDVYISKRGLEDDPNYGLNNHTSESGRFPLTDETASREDDGADNVITLPTWNV